MTVIEFEYDENGMPTAGVGIKNKNKDIRAYFFVDSGADTTPIPKTAAEYLELLEPLKKEEVDVADGVGGGMVPYVIKSATLIIQDHGFNAKIACALTDDVPYLLGRKSVFEKFKVCFDDKRKTPTFLHMPGILSALPVPGALQGL